MPLRLECRFSRDRYTAGVWNVVVDVGGVESSSFPLYVPTYTPTMTATRSPTPSFTPTPVKRTVEIVPEYSPPTIVYGGACPFSFSLHRFLLCRVCVPDGVPHAQHSVAYESICMVMGGISTCVMTRHYLVAVCCGCARALHLFRFGIRQCTASRFVIEYVKGYRDMETAAVT